MSFTPEYLARVAKAQKKLEKAATTLHAKDLLKLEKELATKLGIDTPEAGIPDYLALFSHGLEPGAEEVTLTSDRPYGKTDNPGSKRKAIPLSQRRTSPAGMRTEKQAS